MPSSFDTMNVAALKAELDARGLPTTGKKAELVARLVAASPSSSPPAAAAAAAAPHTGQDPSNMKVPELKAELAALGEPIAGSKAALASRLIAARAGAIKRPAPDATASAAAPPAAKKAKAKASSSSSTVAATPGWFWACDTPDKQSREWVAYPPHVCAEIEAAYANGDAEAKVGDKHAIVLSPKSHLGFFTQKRLDNAHLVRPVTRTPDGSAPVSPPPKPPAANGDGGAAKSTGGASSSAAAAVVGQKSVKAGGVQQVRYQSTAGTKSMKSGGGGMKTEVVKGRAAVDPSCPHADVTHVYDDGKTVWDALLNQTDISKNANKYYVIQLLETDSGGQYYTWNKWGRVGEERPGQNAARGPMSLAQAKDDFKSKFHDKTKNHWENRDAFRTVSGKYTLIERDYGAAPPADGGASSSSADAGASSSADGAPKKAVASRLDPRVQAFVSLIADINMMEKTMREIGFDPAKMPLGKLKKSTIMQGYEVLKELSECLVGTSAISGGGAAGAGAGSSSAGAGGAASGSNGGAVRAGMNHKVLELSNRFYSLIPHTSEGDRGTRTTLAPISTPATLKHKIEMVEALGQIELANKVIDTKAPEFNLHPIDAKYAQLHTSLTPIDTASPLHKLLADYLTNTHGATHSSYTLSLEQAFEVVRDGEAEPFEHAKAKIGNRQLLWHGSRLSNWCGILSTGLRIAPPEAPVTGYMFGKGVYFANMSSKSANYCFASRQDPVGVLMLCDVALGKQYERLSAEYEAAASCRKAKCDSTWGKGRTAPAASGNTALPSDTKCTVPMGAGAPSGVDRTSLLYDEFIVYSTEQFVQKYVLQVKFHFK